MMSLRESSVHTPFRAVRQLAGDGSMQVLHGKHLGSVNTHELHNPVVGVWSGTDDSELNITNKYNIRMKDFSIIKNVL